MYVVWGSTYLGIRIVVDVAESAAALPHGSPLPHRWVNPADSRGSPEGARAPFESRYERSSAVSLLGFLFLFCGVGMVTVAEQTVPVRTGRPAGGRHAAVGRADADRDRT